MRCTGTELEYVDGTNSKYYRLISTESGLSVAVWGRRGMDPTGVKTRQFASSWGAESQNEDTGYKKEAKGYRRVVRLRWESSLSASSSVSASAAAAVLVSEHLRAWEAEGALLVGAAEEMFAQERPHVLLVEGLTHAAVSDPGAAGLRELITKHPHAASATLKGASQRKELDDQIVALVPGDIASSLSTFNHVRRSVSAPAEAADLATSGLASIVATFVREWSASAPGELARALEMARLCRV